MHRFRSSNRAAREAAIDLRRPGLVKGGIFPVSRGDCAALFSSPGR